MVKSRLASRRRQDPGSKWARISIAVLATIGIIDTGSITLNRWGLLGSLSCPGGAEGCDKVLNSPWGTVFQSNGITIPLSFLGLLSYSIILILGIFPLIKGLGNNQKNILNKNWWALFVIACSMSVFSGLLLWLMVVKINAFCFFCVISALISISLFLLTIIGGEWQDPGVLMFRGVIVAMSVLLGGLIWISGIDSKTSNANLIDQGVPPLVISKSDANQIKLAKHLTLQGIKMYSAYWCPHCHDQKELFGKEAAKELVIIECASDGKNNQAKLCERKDISGFPSWEIKGSIISGVRTLEELSRLSEYK